MTLTDPGNPGNTLEIRAEDFPQDWSIGEFADRYRQDFLTQARNWHHYREVSATGQFRGATNYVQIEFKRQRTPEACVEDGVIHLYRSRFFSARMKGFAVTMAVCEEDLAGLEAKRTTAMESFTEE